VTSDILTPHHAKSDKTYEFRELRAQNQSAISFADVSIEFLGANVPKAGSTSARLRESIPAMSIESGLAFVDRCAAEANVETLIAEFKTAIRAFGFHASACGAWDGIGEQRTNRFFFVDWPQDVLKIYAERKLESRDPLVFAARRRMTPFTWDDVSSDEYLPPDSREVYAIARDEMGWHDGFCVPIHGPAGYQGLVSLLARQKLALAPRDRGVLEIMSRAIHDRCRSTMGLGVPPNRPPKLTPREIECMKWVAVGKSNWEIGQVLGIAEATAHFHIENAKKKLEKSTRTEAVALLVLHGLI